MTPAAPSPPFPGAELPVPPRRRPLPQPGSAPSSRLPAASPLCPPQARAGRFPAPLWRGARAAVRESDEAVLGVGPSPGCGAPAAVVWRRLWAAPVPLRDNGGPARDPRAWQPEVRPFRGSPRLSPSVSVSGGAGHHVLVTFPVLMATQNAEGPPGRHGPVTPLRRVGTRSPSLMPPFCGAYWKPVWYLTGFFFFFSYHFDKNRFNF